MLGATGTNIKGENTKKSFLVFLHTTLFYVVKGKNKERRQIEMGDTKNSNNNLSSSKNGGKKIGNVDKTRVGGKNESTKNRSDTNGNSNNNKNFKNKTGRKNTNNGVTSKNSGTKSPKQEVLAETPKSANNNKAVKSKMVDSTTQTSTPLRLHLDGMFEDAAGGYQRPSLNSIESECTEDEEDDEMISELGAPSSPLSSNRSSARTSFSNKELGYGYNFKFEWAQNSRRQQLLIPTESKPRCFEDLENSHELKLLNLTEQLNALVTTAQDNHQ